MRIPLFSLRGCRGWALAACRAWPDLLRLRPAVRKLRALSSNSARYSSRSPAACAQPAIPSRRSTKPDRLLAALCVLAAVPAPAATPRHGYDPLSVDEISGAETLLRADPRSRRALQGRVEWLFTERHEEAKGPAQAAARRAESYLYLYETDQLLRVVVDLSARRVDSWELITGEQPPPTRAESADSLRLALADASTGADVRAEFRRATGLDLAGPEQLVARALVFRADADPQAGKGAAAHCGAHRCMQLLLTTHDGVLINLLPIVDLSRRTVVGGVPFAGAAP